VLDSVPDTTHDVRSRSRCATPGCGHCQRSSWPAERRCRRPRRSGRSRLRARGRTGVSPFAQGQRSVGWVLGAAVDVEGEQRGQHGVPGCVSDLVGAGTADDGAASRTDRLAIALQVGGEDTQQPSEHLVSCHVLPPPIEASPRRRRGQEGGTGPAVAWNCPRWLPHRSPPNLGVPELAPACMHGRRLSSLSVWAIGQLRGIRMERPSCWASGEC